MIFDYTLPAMDFWFDLWPIFFSLYSYVYPLFVPCNGTQSLSPTEKTETEQDLRVKLEAMLGGAQEVLQDVILSEVRCV